ncbi:MAG: BLUF domain-containing protein [Bryobacteraceae bacterium]|nr:BLUF domain-containing protein [Bryobacteraceae bacterium]
MLSLVYVSSADREFSELELMELLEKSREKNTRLGLTGMLLSAVIQGRKLHSVT